MRIGILGGAMKNIYAIASGIMMGLNLIDNVRNAIITRSFVEINKLAKFLGANKKTIFGLSELSDLILNCNSIKSRNTKFGHIILTIKTPNFKEILKSQEIKEGFFTVSRACKMAEEEKIDLSIMKLIYNILYNEYSIKNEINNLLERPITDEF